MVVPYQWSPISMLLLWDSTSSINENKKKFMIQHAQLRGDDLWKTKKHSLYTSVCMTNEHNTSQNYREKWKESLKTINDTFAYSNKTCVLHLVKQSHRPCAFVIGISGESRLIDARILDVFNPSLQSLHRLIF
ncbi:hypothetical protein EDC96DRAFT_540781 [Choanephora cucurbitarum]|nr:hypothetical protein EDC96DRAFT_540781 [Choanephora cucurbitarum]